MQIRHALALLDQAVEDVADQIAYWQEHDITADQVRQGDDWKEIAHDLAKWKIECYWGLEWHGALESHLKNQIRKRSF